MRRSLASLCWCLSSEEGPWGWDADLWRGAAPPGLDAPCGSVVKIRAPNAGGLGSISGQGTRPCMLQVKILHVATKTQHSKNNNNRLPWWLRQYRINLQCRRPGFHPWVRKMPWRSKWEPTPVFLPEEFHGQCCLVGYSPWDCNELGTTERLTHTHTHTHTQTRLFRSICDVYYCFQSIVLRGV